MKTNLILLIIICIGTLLLITTSKTTIHYERPPDPPLTIIVINATVTMYTIDPNETDDTPTITASGELVRHGTIACPIHLPFGTEVEIKGKKYTCNDRMGKRYRHDNYFDIWVPEKEIAIEHGRQKMEVKVIHSPHIADTNRP